MWLTALRTDKFKTAWLSVNLLTQLRRSTAACTAVLPYVLRRGSTRLPDLETIAAELESLYGASITPSVRKLGEIQAVGFEAEFADDGGYLSTEFSQPDGVHLTVSGYSRWVSYLCTHVPYSKDNPYQAGSTYYLSEDMKGLLSDLP